MVKTLRQSYISALLCLYTVSLFADTATVFYQGMNNTQVQAARLVGPSGFIYPYTGEKISTRYTIDCIINLTVHPEIAEVELFNPSLPYWHYALRPYTLFWFTLSRISHWYNGNHIELLEKGKKYTASLSRIFHK